MSAGKAFEPAHIKLVVDNILEQHLNGKEYNVQKTLEWSQQISNLILEKISSLQGAEDKNSRFKYIVNCSLQKHGSGLQSSSACLWNSATDFATCVRFEQKDIDCTVHIYAIAYN